jgi:hypothetical protein
MSTVAKWLTQIIKCLSSAGSKRGFTQCAGLPGPVFWLAGRLVHHLDRADSIEPTDPTCQRPHATQPFYGSLSHFAKVSAIFQFLSVILLQRQPFCYSELNHFCTVNSVIFQLIQHLVIPHCYIAQSFFNCYSARSFFNCYSARSFFNCYSAQSFPVVTELGHFPLLQCLAIPCLLPCSVIPCCYSA